MRPSILIGMLLVGTAFTMLAPSASAGTCTITPIAGGYVLVSCDENGDGTPDVFCVTGPSVGPVHIGPCQG